MKSAAEIVERLCIVGLLAKLSIYFQPYERSLAVVIGPAPPILPREWSEAKNLYRTRGVFHRTPAAPCTIVKRCGSGSQVLAIFISRSQTRARCKNLSQILRQPFVNPQ